MRLHRKIGVLVAALSLLAFAPSIALEGGQAGSQKSSASTNTQRLGKRFVVQIQRNEVLVDVRVLDKLGNPVTDLKQSDFRVFEDGKPQTITSFSLQNVESLAQATGGTVQPKVIDLGKLPPNVQPATVIQNHRLLVLFLDMTSMPVDDLMRVLKAATNFVNTKMTPADLVAVVTYTSELRVLLDFTNDRGALDKVLKGILIGESSSLSGSASEGEAGATNANGEQVVTQDLSEAFTPDETEFNIFNTDEKLAALESLASMLRGIPGRKAVIDFSSGIERTGIENQAQLEAATDAANRSNVSFYTLDARGLVSLPPGGDASSASPSGTALYTGQAVYSQVSSLESSRETLASLAADTGGRTFYDLNNFGPALSEVQKENSTYYLLGYSPANTKSDGRFRRIRVEVDRTDVRVEARPGYFAPKNFRQFTRQDKDLQLEQAMNLDVPFVDLPFVVETSYFLRPDKKYYVVLAAKIPGSAVSFLKKSAAHRTEFDFAWRATDAAGRVAGMLRDTLPVNLSGDAYAQVLKSNILYDGGIVLAPGKYRLKVVVRENESGKIGTFEQPLDLPAAEKTGLMLSSVVLSNQLEESGGKRTTFNLRQGQDPLQVGKRSILPSVTRVFRTNQDLYVYVESYAAKRANAPPESAATASPPQLALVFFRGGMKIAEAGPFEGKQEGTSLHKVSYFVRLPLDKFHPGRYWVQLNVLDPAAGEVAFERIPMAIIKLPAQEAGNGQGESPSKSPARGGG